MPSREATETTETQHAETAHGPIEYETVRCANCRHEMQTDDVIPVGVGLRETGDLFLGEQTRDAYTADEVVHLCSYCAESTFGYDGPASGFDRLTATATWLSPTERAVLLLGSLALLALLALNLLAFL
ncbi:hypothetical protein [Halogranum rubrum]|uniref:Uncharacterized protein n=1 Tax=Halogranum salarium B-1 TaxID=1210908 RepID=J2ZET5_9EURY|nr:hypothetical protein [Halogranum salarium]EJN59175.1 hypothetical protein HSB1_25960 [Halogranum salarium B-1]